MIVVYIIVVYSNKRKRKKVKKTKKATKQQNNKTKQTKMSSGSFQPKRPEDVSMEQINLSTPKKLDNGATTMHLNYGSEGALYIVSPEVDLPFDGKFWPDDSGGGKWAIKANLKGDKCDGFISKMKEMDSYFKKQAEENSMQWFKKRTISSETIDTLYNSIIKESLDPETGEPDGKYPPSFTFKIVKRDSVVQCKIYKGKDDEFNVSNPDADDYTSVDDLVKKGTKVRLLLRCNGVWLANGKFGCTWRADQMKVKPVANFNAYAFDEEDDEVVQKIDENLVESSSDEEDAVEEEKDGEEVEEPVKKVRKVKKVPK